MIANCTAQSLQTSEQFDLFWKYLECRCSMSTPTLPRRKRAPRRLEVGEAAPEFHYQRIYFEVIDFLIAAIEDRFQQKGFQML